MKDVAINDELGLRTEMYHLVACGYLEHASRMLAVWKVFFRGIAR